MQRSRSKGHDRATSSASRNILHKRMGYISSASRFLDWVQRVSSDRTWLRRWSLLIDERLHFRKVTQVLVFSLLLSCVVFWDFDFTYSHRLGEDVTHDILSPLSFEFVDQLRTKNMRDASEANVPPVFDYRPQDLEVLTKAIYLSFHKMRNEARQTDWVTFEVGTAGASQMEQQQHQHQHLQLHDLYDDQVRDFFRWKPVFESLLGHVIDDADFEWLVEHRFSSQVEKALVDILARWWDLYFVDHLDTLPHLNPKTKALIRTSHANFSGQTAGAGQNSGSTKSQNRAASKVDNVENEALVSLEQIRELTNPSQWTAASVPSLNLTNSQLWSARDQMILLRLAKSFLKPNLVYNAEEYKLRVREARERVQPHMVSVKKNEVIAYEGSKIDTHHVTLLREIEKRRAKNDNYVVLAICSALLLLTIILVNISYLRRFTLNRVRVDFKDLQIMGSVLLGSVLLSKLFLFIVASTFAARFNIPEIAYIYAMPAASGVMLVGLLVTSGEIVWGFTFFQAVTLSLLVDNRFSFIVITIVSGLAAARGVHGCKKRNDIYFAGLRTGLISTLMIVFLLTIDHAGDDRFLELLLWSAPAGLVSGVLSSMIAMMLIPLMESVFECTTDVKLLELSNLNHPLLKEMIVRAPGTYHHSLVVGSMVESAAEEIGANPLLAKVMSYYHDIGKMEHAAYFIENQKPGQNPHDHLSPHMSKTILISHIKDGVELGLQYKLGKPILDGIVQHHGTTLIAYFYNRALEMQNQNIDSVSEEEFRYPGPKPQFREAALIMLADSIEAAARSLDEPTPARLQNIVRNIIQRKFTDGQLNECNITLRDLTLVENAFIRILLGVYHQRIDYPRQAGGGAADEVPAAASGGVGAASSPQFTS